MKQILIVEDDKIMNKMLVSLLRAERYQLVSVFTVAEALTAIKEEHFHLAVLDVNLPDGSGYDICRQIRKNKLETAVIFLTANDTEQDMVLGYETGGVDYITKPFPGAVLRHKVKAIFAMLEGSADALGHQIYFDGRLHIDFSAMQASLCGETVLLAPLEFRILEIFIQNKGILLTRQILFEKLWDSDHNFVEEHTLTAAISRIRKKIERSDIPYIQTVYGMGYLFTDGGRTQG